MTEDIPDDLQPIIDALHAVLLNAADLDTVGLMTVLELFVAREIVENFAASEHEAVIQRLCEGLKQTTKDVGG